MYEKISIFIFISFLIPLCSCLLFTSNIVSAASEKNPPTDYEEELKPISDFTEPTVPALRSASGYYYTNVKYSSKIISRKYVGKVKKTKTFTTGAKITRFGITGYVEYKQQVSGYYKEYKVTAKVDWTATKMTKVVNKPCGVIHEKQTITYTDYVRI